MKLKKIKNKEKKEAEEVLEAFVKFYKEIMDATGENNLFKALMKISLEEHLGDEE